MIFLNRLQYYYYYYGGGIPKENGIEYELYMQLDKLEEVSLNGEDRVDDNKESLETIFELYFDGINSELFDENRGKRSAFFNERVKRETYSVVIKFSNQYEDDLTFFRRRNSEVINERIWYLVRLTSLDTGLPASLFIENSLDPQEQKLFISSIGRISYSRARSDQTLVRDLTQFISLPRRPQSLSIVDSLKRKTSQNEDEIHLALYKVGQGNLSAICGSDNLPILYFDLGGGWRFNKRTYQVPIQISFTNCEVIIISHWDWDHLETARRAWRSNNWNAFKDKIWIAPKQPLSSSYADFADFLNKNGTLLFWDNNVSDISFWGGASNKM